MSAHPFHAAFDRLVLELEAHPRVHVACVHRGNTLEYRPIRSLFAKRLDVLPGQEIVTFYAERDGCALIWLDREDAEREPARHRRFDGMPTLPMIDERMTSSLHLIVIPPLVETLGDGGIDYARADTRIGGAPETYLRRFIGFERAGAGYTPAFVVNRGRTMVQVGEDHGVFEGGRPTVAFDDYLHAVIATKGSNRWRGELFGARATEPRFEPARESPRAYFDAHPLSIEDLLPPTREERERVAAAAEALRAAQPADPRLRALAEAARAARAITFEPQKDGRTLLRIERADGAKQLAFLKPEERAELDRALAAGSRE